MSTPIAGNAIGKVLGLAGAGIAAWFTASSAKGRLPEWQRQVNNYRTKLQYDEVMFNHTLYSGEPAMDSWAAKLKHTALYGPFGAKTLWQQAKTYGGGFFNDVIMRNIIPIAAGIGGLYATGFKPHKLISEPYKYLKAALPAPNWSRFGDAAKGVGKWALRNIVRGARAASRNPGVALAIGALGAFGLYRFNRVWNQDEQKDFFNQQLYGGGE